MDMKLCRGPCGELKSLTEFYTHVQMADGYLNICKPCVRARSSANRVNNADRTREYDRRRAVTPEGRWRCEGWRRSHPERAALSKLNSNRVRRAVAKGLLTIADSCADCGVSGVPLEGAHFDYSKPLEVKWLCRPCHRRWDAYQPKTRMPFK